MARRRRQANDNTWRRLTSNKQGSAVRTRRWLNLRVFLALICVAGVAGAVAAIWSLHIPSPAPLVPELASEPVKSIQLRTNGVIREATIWELIGGEGSTAEPLDKIDIFALKGRLESIGQVRAAIIEKRYPSSLVVELDEYHPVAQIRAMRDGTQTPLLVSREGVVFQGKDYPNTVVHALPFLNLAPGMLRVRGDDYEDIPGMETVSELLDVTRVYQPRLYASWRVIDLTRYDPSPSPVLSLITVRTSDRVEITFRPESFAEQLRRLDFILSQAASKSVPPLKAIDLSFSDPVVTVVDGGSIPTVPRFRP